MHAGLLRASGLLLALATGFILPIPEAWQAAVQPLVLTMLLCVFLEARMEFASLDRSHFVLLAVNIALGLGAWLCLRPLDPGVAEAAFFAGITPTATAAALVTRLLGGNVAYVVAAFFVTNVGIAFLLPLLLPWVLPGTADAGILERLLPVALVLVPMVAALGLRRLFPGLSGAATWLRRVSLTLWLAVLLLIAARVSAFARSQDGLSATVWLGCAGASLALCLAGFLIGRRIGGARHRVEASQALGQKNTTLTLYLALDLSGPVAALGPAFYVVWHNLWNAWQLGRSRRR